MCCSSQNVQISILQEIRMPLQSRWLLALHNFLLVVSRFQEAESSLPACMSSIVSGHSIYKLLMIHSQRFWGHGWNVLCPWMKLSLPEKSAQDCRQHPLLRSGCPHPRHGACGLVWAEHHTPQFYPCFARFWKQASLEHLQQPSGSAQPQPTLKSFILFRQVGQSPCDMEGHRQVYPESKCSKEKRPLIW